MLLDPRSSQLIEDWWTTLPSHPIFLPPSTSPASFDPPSSLPHRPPTSPHPPILPPSATFALINQSDLILAIHSQLRLISLLNYKSSSPSPQARALDQPSIDYQILRPKPPSALPNGPITHLIPNPNSRLLAVCSPLQLSVLSLPRREEQSDSNPFIDCFITPVGRLDPIDHLHDHPPDPDQRIVKVLWHPWSHRSSTILLLYSSGILLEFDVSRDARHPTQSLDFNSPYATTILPQTTNAPEDRRADSDHHPSVLDRPSKVSLPHSNSKQSKRPSDPSRPTRFKSSTPKKSTIPPPQTLRSPSAPHRHSPRPGTYAAADLASTTAVSMCFGTGTGDWGPLTLYGVMQNGDMYAICPYLPKNAVIPLSYRNSLLFFLTAKLDSISNSDSNGSLLLELQTPLHQSLEYLNSLYDVPDLNLDDEPDLDNHETQRRVRSSHSQFQLRPLRQGPFLMMPSPIQTNENEEEIVSDLLHLRYSSSTSSFIPSSATHPNEPVSDSTQDSVGVFLIAYQSKLELYLEVEKIEPRWATSHIDLATVNPPTSELPILITYECIDLGLEERLSALSAHDDFQSSKQLSLVSDVRYADTVYVHHAFGIHAISMRNWIESLTQCSSQEPDSLGRNRMIDAIHQKIGSEVVWIAQTASSDPIDRSSSLIPPPPSITSLGVIDDAYLGYALMAMTNDGQLVTQQLQHRPLLLPATLSIPGTESSALTATPLQIVSAPTVLQRSSSHPSYVTLLKDGWQVPSLLNERPSRLLSSQLPRLADPKAINSASMKYVEQVSSRINQYIRKLIEDVNSGQDRLKLQINEYQRQIEQVLKVSETLTGDQSKSRLDEQLRRMKMIEELQLELLKRADYVLQRLSDHRNRSLSREELKWFAELDRMKAEVLGEEGRRVAFGTQIQQLRLQLESMKSKLVVEEERKQDGIRNGEGTGGRPWSRDSINITDHSLSSSTLARSHPHARHHSASKLAPLLQSDRSKFGESQLVPIYHKLAQAQSCIGVIRDQILKLNSMLADLQT